MSNRSFVRQSPSYKVHEEPFPNNNNNHSYYQYSQDVPVKYSPLPSNIHPPQLIEKYMVPVPIEQKTVRTSTPIVEKPNFYFTTQVPVYQKPIRYETQSLIVNPAQQTSFPPIKQVIRSTSSSPRRLSSSRIISRSDDDLVVRLKMENERLSFLLKEKEEELNSFKAKCVHLEAHLTTVEQSPRHNSRIIELENKLNLLLMENQKLNHLIHDKDLEIESWRARSSHQEMAFQDAKILSARIKDLELRNGSLLEELEKWKINFYDIDRARTHDEHLKRSAFKEKETAESEMKNLHNIIKMKESEIEDLKFKYKQLENNNRDGRNLEQKLVIMSGDYDKLQRMFQERSKDYEALKNKNLNLESTIHDLKMKQDRQQDYENRIALLSSEISRLNAMLKDKNDELENWRVRCSKLEYSTKEINVFESEMHRTRELLELRNKEIQEWKARCLKYESSLSDFKSSQFRVKENEDRILLYMADIERLNHTIQAKNQEIERLELTIAHRQGAEKEILSLKEINDIRLREIEELRIKCQRLEGNSFELRDKQTLIMEYENKIVMLSTELERLNQLLRIKSEEVETLKVQTSRVDLGSLGRIGELQSKIDFLNAEVQRLGCIIEAQNREIHEARFSVIHDHGVANGRPFEQNVFLRENEGLKRSLYEKDLEMKNLQRSHFGFF